MLLTFSVANHRSIRDEVELSLMRDSRLVPTDADRFPGEVSPLAAIYGGNASGKSNVLSALGFMSATVATSHLGRSASAPIPTEPFLLDAESGDLPSRFEVQVLLDGVRHQYGFEVSKERVEGEWLYVYPHGRRQIWFERFGEGPESFKFGKQLTGKNKTIAELTRPNSLFLSAAVVSNHEQLLPLWKWFDAKLIATDAEDSKSRMATTLKRLKDDRGAVEKLVGLLAFADLGVCGLEVSARDDSNSGFRELRDLIRTMASPPLNVSTVEAQIESERALSFSEASLELTLQHVGATGPVGLPFDAESLGTRSLVAMGGVVLQVLETGGTLLIDEIDTSLHPQLVREIVKLFQSVHMNSSGAQLIFASHDTSLLSTTADEVPLLDRDQIWFTEKQRHGVTCLYPLTDFHPRKLENLERGYLQGRYGAVPMLAPEELAPLWAKEVS